MTSKFIRTYILPAAAALCAALLILLAIWLAERLNNTPRALLSTDVRVVKGGAEVADNRLQITAADDEGVAMFIAPLGAGLPAKRYPLLRWRVDADASAQGYALIWVTKDEPRALQSLPLLPQQFFAGQVDLQADPRWRGEIVGVGLALMTVGEFPLIIDHMALDPSTGEWGWQDANRRLADNLLQFEPWLPASINFHRGVGERSLSSLPVLLAAWVTLSVLFLLALSHIVHGMRWQAASLVIALFGWLLVDLRWTAELLQRLRSAPAETAGYIGSGAASWLEQLPARLGAAPRRVFLIDDDPGGARALRARYLLSPHSTLLGFSDLPDDALLRPGDSIVILSAPVAIRYDSSRSVLFSASGREVPALLVSAATGVGFAFAVNASQVEGARP
ncbi:MAG: hypothetical protein FJ160_02800 [Gammaproteobacteria bacterium]|nr:hypothetical protein [Gammaproteobacteria bacterium]